MAVNTPDGPRRTGIVVLDAIAAVCVIIISVASLWVAVRTAYIQQRTLAAGVWPYIDIGASDVTAEGARQFTYTVVNSGVGPAIVHWLTLSYGGREYRDPHSLLRDCCAFTRPFIKRRIGNRVLMARESVNFLWVLPKNMTNDEYERLDRAQSTISAVVCYCSVLGECWIFDQQRARSRTPVRECPPKTSRF
jgi:hypothetical protein